MEDVFFEQGRVPSPEEVAEACGCTLNEAQETIAETVGK